jgi:hypothetical protein
VRASEGAQRAFFDTSARSAWAFLKRNYQNNTGLVVAHETYAFVTMWDISATLAAYYAARELGYIDNADYTRRMTKALETLSTAPTFEGKAFNKLYDARNASMIDRREQRSTTGVGWSVLDLGRLMTWLKIIEQRDTSLAPLVRAVVARVSRDDVVHDGYLQGRDINVTTGKPGSYQEGRLGYEQYAAEGFALWDIRAEKALSFREHGKLVAVNGYALPADTRGDDMMTSEPFVLMGMELGWKTQDWKDYARVVYDAQLARYERTGIVTMLSEDALPDPPAYFYYYLLYHNGRPFVVTAPGGSPAPEKIRWVSAKAAFGWHALLPSDYTWTALQAVKYATEKGRGWTAGVYEGTKQSTRTFNLNTAAIIMEAAAYAKRKCPFVRSSCE